MSAEGFEDVSRLLLSAASSAAVGSGPPPEAEQAWPQSSGEEELQLQLALAMSKEEADQVRAAHSPRGGPCPAILSSLLRISALLSAAASLCSLPASPALWEPASCLLLRLRALLFSLLHSGPGPSPPCSVASRPLSTLPALSCSLPQPPSCVPEDDVQLQLALSLSREEHDKVRAASLPCCPLLSPRPAPV